MIDLKQYLANPKVYEATVTRRGKNVRVVKKALQQLQGEADKRKKLGIMLEHSQAELHKRSKDVPTLKGTEKNKVLDELKKLSSANAEQKKKVRALDDAIQKNLAEIPNLLKNDVPTGKDERDNVVLREVGTKPHFDFSPRDYLTIAERLGIIDVARASKVSGSRFGYLLGAAAEMEFALQQYARTLLQQEGFTFVVPPVMIKRENMEAMGYLAGGGESETYRLPDDDLFLVGTSEQSIGPMHRDEILDAQTLPRRYLSFSTCFRREAGSYGKDTKGILRVHQFDKLEMFSLTTSEASDQEHAMLLACAEKLWQGLGCAYRVVQLCSADLGYPSARTYDIEAWLPGQHMYREMGSLSTTTDYQSRALNIRCKNKGKLEYVHMLNGTAFAAGRTIVAILEQFQRADGTVAIPEALRPYCSTDVIRPQKKIH